ncbi:MAG: CaiB/BaiF CoA transferase family protein [Candidatus Hodarchaeota archaeon]
MTKILEGIRVLDLSQFISGPYCTSYLADQGAEVIKVEPPGFGEALRYFQFLDKQFAPLFTILNRNKKSITLDLRKEQSKEIFLNLVEKTDIVIENFIPGTMEKWGLSYEVLKERKPDLIYGAISGFGQTGPRSKFPAFDLIAQAASGMMHAQNIDEGTPRIPFADYSSGLCMGVGIMQALYYREKTGKGQFIDLSMQDLMFSMNIRAQAYEFVERARIHDFTARMLPTYNQYKTKDGLKVVLVTITEGQFSRMMKVIGREELLKDERLSDAIKRFDYLDFLDEVLEEYTLKYDRDEIVKVMKDNRVPCSPVLSVEEIYDDEQLESRGMYNREYTFENVEKATIPNPVLKFSETPGDIQDKAPDLGKNNDEIYGSFLGIEPESLAKLKRKRII